MLFAMVVELEVAATFELVGPPSSSELDAGAGNAGTATLVILPGLLTPLKLLLQALHTAPDTGHVSITCLLSHSRFNSTA